MNADDIAASKRPILDGLDVVTKLRPDMMDPPGQGIFTRCGAYYIWINGQRIVFPPIDPGLAKKNEYQRRVLKPGVAYDQVRGTYVLDAAAMSRSQENAALTTDSLSAAHVIPAYRSRLLGLYDASNGDPIVGAEVIEDATGTFALTTVTGTVTLAFLPEGTSALRIRKAGYTELKMDVSISPRDTMGITLTLPRAP